MTDIILFFNSDEINGVLNICWTIGILWFVGYEIVKRVRKP